jgi:hypothetical protein
MAGVLAGNQVAGITLQSSLGIISRFLMLIFMPALGYMADAKKIDTSYIVVLNFLVAAFLYAIYKAKNYVLTIYLRFANNVSQHGNYFKQSNIHNIFNKKIKGISVRFKTIYIIFIVAYIPYYLSWPTVLIFLAKYPDYRAMIIGMSGLLNGFNTIVTALIIDPKLSQLSLYNRVSLQIHNDFLYLRIFSAALASIIFIGLFLIL